MKNSSKILTAAVVLLLLVNIAMVIFIVKGRNQHDSKGSGRGNPFEVMDKELNMTEQQKAEVKKLRDAHFATIRPLFDSVRTSKSAFFGLLKEANVSDSILNVYSKRITETQTAIDKLTFDHFKRMRSLFDTAQQKKYDEFVQKMVQRGRRDSTGKKK